MRLLVVQLHIYLLDSNIMVNIASLSKVSYVFADQTDLYLKLLFKCLLFLPFCPFPLCSARPPRVHFSVNQYGFLFRFAFIYGWLTEMKGMKTNSVARVVGS